MSSIKPKSGKCLECQPADGEKLLMAKRCFTGPHFHYQKHQQAKYAAKTKAPKEATVKPIKKRIPLNQKRASELVKIAQKEFNSFIRTRDSKGDHFICISCNERKALTLMNAGHYYSAGNHSYLRFNENNVHGQCVKCNCYMHGNLIPYRENLIKKIGIAEVEKLDQWKNLKQRWDRVQLMALIEKYKKMTQAAA